jgi:amidophosphoribosyltransferase
MDLLARSIIMELEGEEGFNHLEEYSDSKTERGQNMRKAICEKMHFTSLEYQSLEGIFEAIGLEPCKVCTYCWNGKG